MVPVFFILPYTRYQLQHEGAYLKRVMLTSKPGLQSSNRDKKSKIKGSTKLRTVITKEGPKSNSFSPPSNASLAFCSYS